MSVAAWWWTRSPVHPSRIPEIFPVFRFFENRVNPFPPEHPVQPPSTLFAFCRHYVRGIERWLLLMSLLTALLAVSEALLYGILGQVVD